MDLVPEEELSYVVAKPLDDMEAVRIKADRISLMDTPAANAKDPFAAVTHGSEKFVIEPKVGKNKARKIKQAEKAKTKGKDWFGMKAPELTEETKRDLEVLQMRGVLDPKRFYKKNDSAALPKYFQIGKVLDAPADYYADRVPNKQRKSTLVDELMADAEFKKYNKRKYAEIIEEKSKSQRRYQGKQRKKPKNK